MKPMQNAKFTWIAPPGALVDDAAVTTTPFDTAGNAYAVITIGTGAMDAAATVFKVTECETVGGTYTDVPGADFSVSPLSLPTATDDNKGWRIFMRTKGVRKRFIDVDITIAATGNGDYVVAWVDQFNPISGFDTASERGLAQNAIV